MVITKHDKELFKRLQKIQRREREIINYFVDKYPQFDNDDCIAVLHHEEDFKLNNFENVINNSVVYDHEIEEDI